MKTYTYKHSLNTLLCILILCCNYTEASSKMKRCPHSLNLGDKTLKYEYSANKKDFTFTLYNESGILLSNTLNFASYIDNEVNNNYFFHTNNTIFDIKDTSYVELTVFPNKHYSSEEYYIHLKIYDDKCEIELTDAKIIPNNASTLLSKMKSLEMDDREPSEEQIIEFLTNRPPYFKYYKYEISRYKIIHNLIASFPQKMLDIIDTLPDNIEDNIISEITFPLCDVDFECLGKMLENEVSGHDELILRLSKPR